MRFEDRDEIDAGLKAAFYLNQDIPIPDIYIDAQFELNVDDKYSSYLYNLDIEVWKIGFTD